ncbi:hypothetical protein OIU84_007610 [Salix udensis]|uniref:Uncharacterized protein n=1 Tax=Salix udensis TaxID=889485 RepID=A0AAD6JTF8_9ROSI|nr:hypothetical protein OIU84_007610 [Salix udensis]
MYCLYVPGRVRSGSVVDRSFLLALALLLLRSLLFASDQIRTLFPICQWRFLGKSMMSAPANVVYLSTILGLDGPIPVHKCDCKCQNEHVFGNMYRCRLTAEEQAAGCTVPSFSFREILLCCQSNLQPSWRWHGYELDIIYRISVISCCDQCLYFMIQSINVADGT